MEKKAERPEWDRQRILSLRRHLRMTQRELADKLGTRQQTISEWETGMYKPRGASSTLLSIIAREARFKYDATPPKKLAPKP
ncbi:MAG: helix-turn-helix transcriptional regulator [Chloroflexi bacterium]|nr:helix-turn-helix transcriptional regulator [Chloroflexota bacterium]